METHCLSEIRTHLEYLGYVVEDQEELLGAFHPAKPWMLVQPYRQGFLLSTNLLPSSASDSTDDRRDFLEFINTLNQNATEARCFLDEEGELVIEAWYPGPYDKARFAAFMDNWNHDTVEILNREPELVERFLG